MTKKEICLSNDTIAYYSGFGGLEIKSINYDINDYIYCVTGAWTGSPSYHKCKIYYNYNDNDYFRIQGVRVPLNECIRV